MSMACYTSWNTLNRCARLHHHCRETLEALKRLQACSSAGLWFTCDSASFEGPLEPTAWCILPRLARLGLAVCLGGLPSAPCQAALPGMDYKELILQYADSLRTDLTWASKTHINMLTMLAGENKAAAASICAAIERHILSVRTSPEIPFQ